MKIKKEETRICDNCEYFEISPGGCTETCHMVRMNSTIAYNFAAYADERISGNKQTCKEFRKII